MSLTKEKITGGFVGIHGADEVDNSRTKTSMTTDHGKAIATDRLSSYCYTTEPEQVGDAPITNHNEPSQRSIEVFALPPATPQPDHTEKVTLFELLNASEACGVELTESCAMHPGAAVSGLLFSPRIALLCYLFTAKRSGYASTAKGDLETNERLGPWLGYA